MELSVPSPEKTEKPIVRYYLFHGLNDHKIDKWVSALIKRIIPPGAEAFDLDRFSGRDIDIANVINSLSTPPVLSPFRVAILTAVDKMAAGGQNKLESFLSRIPEYSVLAMTATKTDKRLKLFKRLVGEKDVHAFEHTPYKPDEATRMVAKFASDKGKQISAPVAAVMVDTFGPDAYRLENEVEKLSLYIADRTEIEKKDLAFSSGFDRVETAYDLPDLIFKGNLKEALKLARTALASGIAEMQMLYILKNHLLRLNTAQQAGSVKVFISRSRIPYKPAQELYSQSRTITQEAIAKGLTFVFRAEYSLKSARFHSETVIELLIVALFLTFRGNIPKDRLYLL
jgi:DNA polymerase III subunit delta